MENNTPHSLRLQIAVAGRTNSGKSTLLNLIAAQDVAITSPVPGTTTDVVAKAMELRPLGPVLFLDTAGIDDATELGGRRVERSFKALDRADVVLLVTEPGVWGEPEECLTAGARERKIAVVPVVNKCDLGEPEPEFIEKLTQSCGFAPLLCRANGGAAERERFLPQLKEALIAAVPDDFIHEPPLLGDLVRPGDTVVLIVPVDIQAPKGRLIMPQMQLLRDALDHGVLTVTVRESEYDAALKQLKTPPALVVCDSQVVDFMIEHTPPEIPCTTFSIIFSRFKGDMEMLASGAGVIGALKPGDRVLIAEACTHHESKDDIGRCKIPRWLTGFIGGAPEITVAAGRDFPPDVGEYRMVIQCGCCMLNRRETLRRIELSRRAGVPITNYGMAISCCRGVLERVLSPFPEALKAYRSALAR